MVVVDLDGTLARSDQTLSTRTLSALEELGIRGIPRVIATGRSVYAARKVLSDETPFDYLIFSTGAGTAYWPKAEIVESFSMPKQSIHSLFRTLHSQSLDFMLHAAIPENHYFHTFGDGRNNPDFHERIRRGGKLSICGKPDALPETATQFLVVANESDGPELFLKLQKELGHFSVVRATSPLDHKSIWIEIFPKHVTKGNSTAALAKRLGVAQREVLAIGNDYNDLDMLAWAGTSFLLANSPVELRTKFNLLPSNDEDGVAIGIERWLTER